MNALPDESRLVPEGLPYDTVAPFIGLTLSTLYLLETQPSVQQYTQAQPQAHRAIRALSAAVAQAGSRVRDTAPHGNMFDQHIEMFTAEEFWMFDLAIDVIAMFAAAGGLDPDTHALVIDDLQKLDKNTRNPHWKSQVPTAGDGPAEFRQLRAHIPRHENQAPASEDLILESLISAQTLQEWLPAHARTPEGLVPDGLGYDAVASFLNLTLATLTVLGSDPAVQQYAEANPDALRAIRALSAAVAQAGIRVRDTAPHANRYDQHMEMFTAEEFWMFDLAIDVIAMFVTGGACGPTGAPRSSTTSGYSTGMRTAITGGNKCARQATARRSSASCASTSPAASRPPDSHGLARSPPRRPGSAASCLTKSQDAGARQAARPAAR